MSIAGFHQITIKPTLPASKQHTAAFAADDCLFNWTKFSVPKYPGRLIGCTALVRGTNGARQEQPFDLYFSTSDDYSLVTGTSGTAAVNEAVSFQPNNDLIGSIAVLATHYTDGLNTMEVANVPTTARLTMTGAQDPNDLPPRGVKESGNKVMYIAGVAQGAFDFRSTVKTTGAHGAGTANDITVDTTSALINFAKGDLINAHDDAIVGTVGSIPDATSIILDGGATNTSALANNDDLYNVNPITIILTFSYI